MQKLHLEHRHSPVQYISYVVGFILSILATLLAYLFVINNLWQKEVLVYTVAGVAILQLIVQVVFFLHIGRGTHWKLITFIFTVLIVGIIVVGSVWIMNNLNYNMMNMSPEQMKQYMSENEGI